MESQTNAQLSRFTTLKVGGPCRRLVHPTNISELQALFEELTASNEPWYILGGGSNLLVSSDGYDGTVIRTNQLTQISVVEPGTIEAAAGYRLAHLAKYAAELGLTGLEFAVGIPGTAGGAVVMNAGAHGSCFANIVESVTIFDTNTRKLCTLNSIELDFQYRSSKLDPDKQIVVSAILRLQKGNKETIIKRTQDNEDYRQKTQPIGCPNAGSTFKNPSFERSAGYLLDQAGAKNMREGDAAVSDLHANFVINLGNATSQEITTLLARMQNAVVEKFQIRLEPEWKHLGKFSPAELAIWNKQ